MQGSSERRHIMRVPVAGGSDVGKESLRMEALQSMMILVMAKAGVVALHAVDLEEGRK